MPLLFCYYYLSCSRGNACWERRYVRLAGSTLLIFAHEPSANSAHMSPIEQYPLCPPDSVAIVSQATQAEVGSVAKSDVPFIIKAGIFHCFILSFLNILVIFEEFTCYSWR